MNIYLRKLRSVELTLSKNENTNSLERTRLQLELENLRKKRKEDAQKRLANMYYTAQQEETTQNEPVVISEQDHSVASMLMKNPI